MSNLTYTPQHALYFYTSNRLAPLAHKMIDESMEGLGVFDICTIITQTSGMNVWLTQQIANRKGIAALIEFIQPADIILHIYRIIVDAFSPKISRNNIDWLIYTVLSSKEFQLRYPIQAAFYLEDGEEDDVKKWELAATLADLFDQYQIYRHTIIKDWKQHHKSHLVEKYDWQYYIWNAILDIAGSQFPDMTQMHDEILTSLQQTEKIQMLQARIPRITFFGISILTPFHYQLIYEVSKYIPCYFYLLNPAPEEMWEQDRSSKEIAKFNLEEYVLSGNALLTQWGKVLQSTFKILNQDDAYINSQILVEAAPPASNSLLSKIQSDIYFNRSRPQTFSLTDLQDGSLYISSHYSLQIEVQTLYNHIVHTISKHPNNNFTERDILVITTDIQLYAPYIKAVFDNAPFKFQYTIADEPLSSRDQILGGFIELLQLSMYDVTVDNVLKLLEYEAIRKQFQIIDVPWCRSIIQRANIRFGIHNNQADDTYLVSWMHGLKKLMYSICLPDSTRTAVDDITYITVNIPDSQIYMDQIVHLYHFCTKLFDHLQQRQVDKPLESWQIFIEETLQTFFDIDEEQKEEEYIQILQSIQQFHDVTPFMSALTIPYEVISTRLTQHIDVQQRQSNFLSRGITFCGPLHFRSIPFIYIGFLGLDFDKYPRRERQEDWNMIKHHKQLGDRNKKENDKHLFLESLLAAQSYLYLSYIGKSIQDNTAKPASIIIDELIDYIQEGFEEDNNAKQLLVHQYPLQTYSHKYNHIDSKLLPNYFIKHIREFPIPFSKNETSNSFTPAILALKDLQLLMTDSIKYYYQKSAKIFVDNYDNAYEDTEVFHLDALQRWHIDQRLLELNNSASAWQQGLQDLYLSGNLPLKNTGTIMQEKMLEEMERYWSEIENITHTTDKRTAYIQIALQDGINIQGSIHDIFGDTIILYRNGKSTTKYCLQAYVLLLAAIVSGEATQAYIILSDKVLKSQIIDVDTAAQQLELLGIIATEGLQAPMGYTSAMDDKYIEPVDYPSKLKSLLNNPMYTDAYLELFVNHEPIATYHPRYKRIFDLLIQPALHAFA